MVCLSDMCMWVDRDVSAKVHLDGNGVVCAALDSGIICYKGHQTPMHSAYARHNASRRHLLPSWRTGSADSIGECNLPQSCVSNTRISNFVERWHASFRATHIAKSNLAQMTVGCTSLMQYIMPEEQRQWHAMSRRLLRVH